MWYIAVDMYPNKQQTLVVALQVLAKDLFGNPVIGAMNVGPGEIEAILRGPETIDLTPVKAEAGCLTLGYTVMKAWLYDLSITHDGRHINGSPWKVRTPLHAAPCHYACVFMSCFG